MMENVVQEETICRAVSLMRILASDKGIDKQLDSNPFENNADAPSSYMEGLKCKV